MFLACPACSAFVTNQRRSEWKLVSERRLPSIITATFTSRIYCENCLATSIEFSRHFLSGAALGLAQRHSELVFSLGAAERHDNCDLLHQKPYQSPPHTRLLPNSDFQFAPKADGGKNLPAVTCRPLACVTLWLALGPYQSTSCFGLKHYALTNTQRGHTKMGKCINISH